MDPVRSQSADAACRESASTFRRRRSHGAQCSMPIAAPECRSRSRLAARIPSVCVRRRRSSRANVRSSRRSAGRGTDDKVADTHPPIARSCTPKNRLGVRRPTESGATLSSCGATSTKAHRPSSTPPHTSPPRHCLVAATPTLNFEAHLTRRRGRLQPQRHPVLSKGLLCRKADQNWIIAFIASAPPYTDQIGLRNCVRIACAFLSVRHVAECRRARADDHTLAQRNDQPR